MARALLAGRNSNEFKFIEQPDMRYSRIHKQKQELNSGQNSIVSLS